MLCPQSKESGHMSTTDMQKKKKKKPSSHSLISLALFMFAAYAWILLLLWYSGFAAESEGSL